MNNFNNVGMKEKSKISEDSYEYLNKKYKDYNNHISKILVELSKNGKKTCTCDPSMPTINGLSQEFIEKLIANHITCLNRLENSLDLSKINEYINSHFSLIMSSVFQSNGNISLPYSIIHEYLEDSILSIYETFITKRMTFIKDNHIDTKDKNIWNINHSDISDELLEEITERIIDNNIIKILHNPSFSRRKSLTETTNHFIQEFSRYMHDVGDGENELIKYMSVHKSIQEEINLTHKLSTELLSKQVRNLLASCKNFINDGKLIYKGKVLYDFKNYYTEMLSKGYMSKNNVYLTQNTIVPSHIDNIVQTFKYNNQLELLRIYGNNTKNLEFPLEKIVITILMYCPDLKCFNITESNLQNTQIHSIIRLLDYGRNLRSVDVSSNFLGENGIKLITDCLKNNKTILHLSVSNNNLPSTCGIYFGELLSCNSTIEKLSLGGNSINGKGFHSFSTSLINNNKTLKQLDISSNNLTDSDLYDLSRVIIKNKVLDAINVSNNLFSIDQINALGLAIKENDFFKTIYLYNIGLDSEKAPYLFYSLSESKLDAIYLDYNPFEEIGAILFSNVIKLSKTLKIVSMKQCKLNNSSLICLSKAIEINTTLQYISLEENYFEDPAILILIKSVVDKNIKILLSSSFLTAKSNELLKDNSKHFKLI